MADDHTRAWNRFSADFRVPDSDDAARVANEVKASIDTWVQKSLNDLQTDMAARMQVQLATLRQNFAESQQSLASIDAHIEAVQDGIAKLNPADPNLAAAIQDLQKQAATTRTAMKAMMDQWEKNGQDSVATAVSIAKTVATFA